MSLLESGYHKYSPGTELKTAVDELVASGNPTPQAARVTPSLGPSTWVRLGRGGRGGGRGGAAPRLQSWSQHAVSILVCRTQLASSAARPTRTIPTSYHNAGHPYGVTTIIRAHILRHHSHPAPQTQQEVFYAPHIVAASKPVGLRIEPIRYSLKSDGSMVSNVKYTHPLVGSGWLSASGARSKAGAGVEGARSNTGNGPSGRMHAPPSPGAGPMGATLWCGKHPIPA